MERCKRNFSFLGQNFAKLSMLFCKRRGKAKKKQEYGRVLHGGFSTRLMGALR
jgi:hypothetical protein